MLGGSPRPESHQSLSAPLVFESRKCFNLLGRKTYARGSPFSIDFARSPLGDRADPLEISQYKIPQKAFPLGALSI